MQDVQTIFIYYYQTKKNFFWDFIREEPTPKIKVRVKDTSQNINEIIECEISDKTSILREKLIDKIPELKDDNFFLLFNGDKIDTNKTIEENKIKDNSVILLIKNNLTVKFRDTDGKKYELKIESNKKFSELLEELCKKQPKLKKEKYNFICNSNNLNSNLTIIANGINDNDMIFINKPISFKIKVRIQDTSQNINEIIECEISDKASILREKIIDKKPELNNIEFVFIVNGNNIDEKKTIKENKIKNGDFIILIKNDESLSNNNFSNLTNMITIIIKSLEPQFDIPFACKMNYRFSTILEELYKQKPECRDQNKEFTIENRIIDINLTLEENDIKDGDTIYYKKKEEEEEEEEEEEKGEEVDPNEISVIFRNAQFKFSLICNKRDIFKELKDKFLEKKPEYKNKNVYFIANGDIVDTIKTLEENNIKDSDNIIVNDY